METVKISPLQGRAMLQPETWNEEAKTIEVVFATEQPVVRYSWDKDGYYNEVLSIDTSSIRMERINSGAPVLDSHDTWSGLESQIGVVERAWIQGTELRAIVKLSERESLKEIVNDIKSGIIRNISVGYRVYKLEQTESGMNTIPTYRATDWEPYEISFVTVPADHKSGVRTAENTNEVIIIKPEPAEPEQSKQMEDNTNKVTAEEVRNQALEAERKRTSEILNLVRIHKLEGEFGEKMISEGKSIEDVRAAVLERLATATPKTDSANASAGKDLAVEHEKRAFEATLMLRGNADVSKAGYTQDEFNHAKKLIGRSALQLAEMSLKRAGFNTDNMSKMEIATRAITQTTSDFPVLLANALNKTLQASYDLAADTWRQFCAIGSLTDFRAHTRHRLGQFGKLEEVVEGGEYKYVSVPDGEAESITGKTYGNLINLSRQTIINDDLGQFMSLATRFGAAAGLTIEESVYALLLENGGLGPTMSDSLPLFDAGHANISTSAALSVAGLEADRVKMMQQKDPEGKRFLNIRPYALVVPIGLGGAAKVLNQAQFDNDSDKFQKPNVVAGLFSNIVDTPYLTGTRRYVFANPMVAPAIEVAFLDGVQTPYLEMQEAFNQDGTSWKVRLDFGVAAIDWRGAVTNAGV
jgi:phage major head subunit gpT-like protein